MRGEGKALFFVFIPFRPAEGKTSPIEPDITEIMWTSFLECDNIGLCLYYKSPHLISYINDTQVAGFFIFLAHIFCLVLMMGRDGRVR